MIRFIEHFSLKKYNTFGTEAIARYFFEFTEVADILDAIQNKSLPAIENRLILGGGSNLLFTSGFDGLVLYPNIPGIEPEREDRNDVYVRVGAGVVWDDFVSFAVGKNWGGIENLSLIPGKVGAAPVQNIGAYGQEVSQVVESVTGVDLRSGDIYEIDKNDCNFAYRNSIFKSKLKSGFIITSVLFRLSKFPELVLNYKGVAEELREIKDPGIEQVRDVVIALRQSKLPDPAVIGNAGSFFKNPVVDAAIASKLKDKYPEMPVYGNPETGSVKLSAGWLIEQCGWKGAKKGDTGTYKNHALVLVNYGNASGEEIFNFSEEIRNSVLEKFGVEMEREVQVVRHQK